MEKDPLHQNHPTEAHDPIESAKPLQDNREKLRRHYSEQVRQLGL